MKAEFIFFEGEFVSDRDARITMSNRSFRYGDGFFESIRCLNEKPCFFDLHFQRIQKAAQILKLKSSYFTQPNELLKLAEALLVKNGLSSARLRFQFYRSGQGLYTPHSNNAQLFAQAQPISKDSFSQSSEELKMGLSGQIRMAGTELSNIKTNAALPQVLAGLEAKENEWDEALILNQHDRLCSAISSNIFLVKNGITYYPPLSEGPVDGVMRRQIIRLLHHNGFLQREKTLQLYEVKEADEVFLTNAVRGVRSVIQFEDIVYKTELTRKICSLLG